MRTEEITDSATAGTIKAELRRYKTISAVTSSIPPLMIEVLLDTTRIPSHMTLSNGGEGNAQRILKRSNEIRKIVLERWTLDFVPSSSSTTTTSPSSPRSNTRPQAVTGGLANEEEMIQPLYQNCITHFERMAILLADLPGEESLKKIRMAHRNVETDPGSDKNISIVTRLVSPSSGIGVKNGGKRDETELLLDKGLENESVAVERVRMKGIDTPFGYVIVSRATLYRTPVYSSWIAIREPE
jgi:hypothetical protein